MRRLRTEGNKNISGLRGRKEEICPAMKLNSIYLVVTLLLAFGVGSTFSSTSVDDEDDFYDYDDIHEETDLGDEILEILEEYDDYYDVKDADEVPVKDEEREGDDGGGGDESETQEDTDDFYDYASDDDDDDDDDELPDVDEVDSDIVDCIRRKVEEKDTKTKFLPNLTPEILLRTIKHDELLSHARDDEVIRSLNRTRLDVFELLLLLLPVELSAEIASKPGILVGLREEQILMVSSHLEILDLTDPVKILELTNARPTVIPKLPWQAVDLFIRMPGFLTALETSTVEVLVQSTEFARILENIPKRTLAQVVRDTPDALLVLPEIYPARRLVERLIVDEEFLAMIPVETHVYLAESPFRHRLSETTVREILRIYPDLPTRLSDRGLEENSKYIESRRFLNALPCSVAMTLGARIEGFVDRLDRAQLRSTSTNRHIWRCLPVETIRTIMQESRVGTVLTMRDVYDAASSMSSAKRMDWDVVLGLFKYQFPDLVRGKFRRMVPDFLKSSSEE